MILFKKKNLFFIVLFMLLLNVAIDFLYNFKHEAKAQLPNTQNMSDSIVSSEFSTFPPKLLVDYPSGGYIAWNTSFGVYVFGKASQRVEFYFIDRYGVKQIEKSVFWINTTALIDYAKISNVNVVIANDTFYRVDYSCLYKGGGLTKDTVVGTFSVVWHFYKETHPKITVYFNKVSDTWMLGGLGDFNVVWVTLPLKQYVKLNETCAVDYNVEFSKTVVSKEDKQCEIGGSSNPMLWTDSWVKMLWDDVEGVTVLKCGVEKVWGGKGVTVVFPLNVDLIDPSIVGTSSTSFAVSYPFQRKIFFDWNVSHLFWVFYSDGTKLVYRTSTDGSTWSSATTVRACTSGERFSVWFDGTYIYYVYAYGSPLYYRYGLPNADGSISWIISETSVDTAFNFAYYPFISVRLGQIWFGYIDLNTTDNLYYPFAQRRDSSPYRLSSSGTSTRAWSVSIIPINSGILAIYASSSQPIRMKFSSGFDWKNELQTTSYVSTSTFYSAVADGDNVHIVFLSSVSYDLKHVKYVFIAGGDDILSQEHTIKTSLTFTSAPVLCRNATSDRLVVFWATKTSGSPPGALANHIYYQTSDDDGETWSSSIDFADETVESLYSADRLTCFYEAYGGYIALVYVTKTESPFNVKFKLYTANTAPTIGEFQAPLTVYANKYFFLNVSINDAEGVSQFVNATVEISNGIILKWDNATNSFSKIQDTYGYCTLDVSNSFRTVLNSTAYKLSFRIKLSWSFPEGYVSIIAVNTKCFDSQGASGSNSKANLFYFEDDLIVYSASVNDSRINPLQAICFTGKLYYQGTTVPPEDVNGITVKVDLGNTNKGSTTIINSDGSFSISFLGESSVGLYSYTVYALTDENSVQNQTVNVIVDFNEMLNFKYSFGTLFNLTVQVKSMYDGPLNSKNVKVRAYFNDSLLFEKDVVTDSNGYFSIFSNSNLCFNGTLTFNVTNLDYGIESFSYSCPVYVYVSNIEVFSIDPVIVYSGNYMTIIMKYLPKARINDTYIPLSNVYWKALIYAGDKYYGFFNFPLYNGTFANDYETKTLSFPCALSEGSYKLNMTFYIRGSDVLLGNAETQYFIVKKKEAVTGGAVGSVVYTYPLTVIVRDSKGLHVSGVTVTIIDIYNATVYSGKTDAWGTVIVQLAPGTYNVTVKYDDTVLTETVTISNEPITKTFSLPSLTVTPITVVLDSYSVLWLFFALLGAIGSVVIERRGYTFIAVLLGLFTVGSLLHAVLVITHRTPPLFTVPSFNELLKLPSVSLPSLSLDLSFLSLSFENAVLIVACFAVMFSSIYYITHRKPTYKPRTVRRRAR